MKISIFIALFALAFGITQKPDFNLEVGSVLPAEYLPKKKVLRIETQNLKLRPFIERKVSGVDYIIAYEEETRTIKYINTADKKFKPDGGLRVGSYIEVTKEQLNIYPAWEVSGPKTKEGWRPVLGYGNKITILVSNKDFNIYLSGFPKLPDGEIVKAKIIGFSKGG